MYCFFSEDVEIIQELHRWVYSAADNRHCDNYW